jgi:hypothetical protein
LYWALEVLARGSNQWELWCNSWNKFLSQIIVSCYQHMLIKKKTCGISAWRFLRAWICWAQKGLISVYFILEKCGGVGGGFIYGNMVCPTRLSNCWQEF